MTDILARKRRLKIFVSVLIVAVVLVGGSVTFYNRYKNNPLSGIAHAEDLMEGIKGEQVDLLDSLTKEFTDSTSQFSIDMFKQLANEENAVYSPTPLYLALGLILNGAEGETKAQIEDALTKHGLDPEELNMYYKTLIEDLSQKDDGVELNICNSIWYSDKYEPNKEFLGKNKTYYGADAYMLDFNAPDAPKAMNNWISISTKGRIDKMVDNINPLDRMFLFSTIYFEGKWANPFKGKDTFSDTFYVDDSTNVTVDFMKMKKEIKNVKTDTEQAILLPYKGDRYAFVAILPDENTDVRDYISSMSKDSITDIVGAMNEREVTINLPKFEIEFGKNLNDELKALGMTDMFGDLADFSGMSENGDDDLYVEEVAQKTFIKVDEKSTIAASAVKINMALKSSMPEYIVFNRPFVYAIFDTKTGLPIFLGILDNPQK